MLESKQRLQFPIPCSKWIETALGYPGVELAPLCPEIAVGSANLPHPFHADPADRILVATAQHYKCPIVTNDQKILNYDLC